MWPIPPPHRALPFAFIAALHLKRQQKRRKPLQQRRKRLPTLREPSQAQKRKRAPRVQGKRPRAITPDAQNRQRQNNNRLRLLSFVVICWSLHSSCCYNGLRERSAM